MPGRFGGFPRGQDHGQDIDRHGSLSRPNFPHLHLRRPFEHLNGP